MTGHNNDAYFKPADQPSGRSFRAQGSPRFLPRQPGLRRDPNE